jgi:hypothetical protein
MMSTALSYDLNLGLSQAVCSITFLHNHHADFIYRIMSFYILNSTD